jgi:hypothetical protein
MSRNFVVASPVAPNTASTRLAILLMLGLLSLVGVVIITMSVSKGGLNLPDIECKTIIVGHSPGGMMMRGAGGPQPIYEPKYEIVIRDVHIPLPTVLVRMFVAIGNRCE